MVIDLGGVTCQVDHVGGDHSADSCVVFVPEEKVLFMGDCIFMDIYSGLWRYTTGNLLPLLEKISGYDAEVYVLSHSAPLKAKAMKKYIQTLKQVALAVKEHGGNRERIIRCLGGRPGSFQMELIDRFINGIRIPARNVP
jgi:glyoxylase-like metal-dependent hydrolase (beta-lactamase superfamily II)